MVRRLWASSCIAFMHSHDHVRSSKFVKSDGHATAVFGCHLRGALMRAVVHGDRMPAARFAPPHGCAHGAHADERNIRGRVRRQCPAASAPAADLLPGDTLNRSCLSSLTIAATSSGFTDGSCLLSPPSHALISSKRRSEMTIGIPQCLLEKRSHFAGVFMFNHRADSAGAPV